MSVSLLWLDSETTGLKHYLHDIIQLAAIPVINGINQKPFNEFCQPLKYEVIEPEALAIHGITIEQLKTFQESDIMLKNFISYLKAFNTKFMLAGYNVSFDQKFLHSMFSKHNLTEEYKKLFLVNTHDTMFRAKPLKTQGKIRSLKLTSVAEFLGVKLNDAHNALYDIQATIEVDKKLSEMMGEHKIEEEDSILIPSFNVPEVPALHIHSEYSIYDSATTSDSWFKWASKNNISGIAFPDHIYATSLYGAINPPKAKDGSLKYPNVTQIPAISIWIKDEEKLFTLNAWAISNQGYNNLVKLTSLGWNTPTLIDKEISAGSLTLDQLKLYTDGIIFGSADDLGIISYLLDISDSLEDLEIKLSNININIPNLVLEYIPLDIQRFFDKNTGFTAYSKSKAVSIQNRSKAINVAINYLVNNSQYKAIISSSAHFINKEDKVVQDCKMKNSFSDERYFWESRNQFPANEQFAILKNHIKDFTLEQWNECKEVAEDIVEKAKAIKIKHNYHLPKFNIPKNIQEKTEDYNKQLYLLTLEKIKEHGRWSNDPVYVERFKKEIDVIKNNKIMNFLPYFLIYEDISSHARSVGILQGLARGSAGGSLLSYYLKITHIDPIKNDLPFERFLSHARINALSFPDIDSDFENRGKILKYLKEKYNLGFAQIGTFQKMKIKSAIKHAMFAIHSRSGTDRDIKDICDLIPDSPQGLDEQKFVYGYVDSEGIEHEGVIHTTPELKNFFTQYPDCEELVNKLLGLPASVGRHPSAFVIASIDLTDGRAPTFITDDAEVGKIQVVQFDGPMCEKSGLVKADILGVTTIQTISNCIKLVKQTYNIDLLEEDDQGLAYIYRLPEDQEVFQDFYEKRTDSAFQFNTDLVKTFLPDFKPESISDLSALTALVRPGALDVEFSPNVSATQQYINVRNKKYKATYIHPELEPILKETYGVVAYQETLMKILVDIVGYSLEESDQIRSAIAKKKRDVMTSAFERVRTATAKRGYTPEQSQAICDTLTAYSNYSFNRSHSKSYATLGYITMWLKNKYPLQWWASELNLSSEDKLRKYMPVISDIIKPPSLGAPSTEWQIINDSIVAPLTSVKQMAPKTVQVLVDNGPTYESFYEFLQLNTGKEFHIGKFVSCLSARALDSFLNPDLPYIDARKELIATFMKHRKLDLHLITNKSARNIARSRQKKKKVYDVFLDETDPFKLFIYESEASKIFAKSLLDDKDICRTLEEAIPALKRSKNKELPYSMGEDQNVKVSKNDYYNKNLYKKRELPLVRSVLTINDLLEKDSDRKTEHYHGIFLFKGSTCSGGISKKTGREWKKMEVNLSDGFRPITATIWDRDKALKWPINTPVIVTGRIQYDWKGMPSISLNDIEKVFDLYKGRELDD